MSCCAARAPPLRGLQPQLPAARLPRKPEAEPGPRPLSRLPKICFNQKEKWQRGRWPEVLG